MRSWKLKPDKAAKLHYYSPTLSMDGYCIPPETTRKRLQTACDTSAPRNTGDEARVERQSRIQARVRAVVAAAIAIAITSDGARTAVVQKIASQPHPRTTKGKGRSESWKLQFQTKGGIWTRSLFT